MNAVVQERAPSAARVQAARRPPVSGRRFVLTPPEGVPVHFALPEIGTRIAAQFVDIVVVLVVTVLLFVAIVYADPLGWNGSVVILSLLSLLLGTPFFILCELLSNGRTPGKRLCGIRVVSVAGQGLSTHQVVVRNLLKEVEIFLPLRTAPLLLSGAPILGAVGLVWGIVAFVIVVRSRARQRIGDLAAGTVVVDQPRATLLPDLAVRRDPAGAFASAPLAGRFAFTTAQLDLYGAYELQVLERLLRERPAGATGPTGAMEGVARSIHRKIEYSETVAPGEVEAFLLAFYRAQRAYLEEKKLFGDARGDKHHRAAARTKDGDRRP